eukprot:TRINITY_DN88746_c0_g1_i1.p1 TRINITY_DN88746_c0_g1~~TRINITY_DN88746_c0_g1_i1.p1  ORF type:complete len:480 (+),score=114.56 TRINITY_DN88746_c0_g1_i1:46-1485(+)
MALLSRSGTVHFKHVFTSERPGNITDYFDFDTKKNSQMGEGSYGHVYKGKDKHTGAMRAIKSINIDKVGDTKKLEAEIEVQQNLDHPNIVKLYEVFKDSQRYYLVMEICSGGELFDRIIAVSEETGAGFSERDAATYMTHILSAMRYLHSKDYAHRDIKPENFLLENERRDAAIKVIDFGLAKKYVHGKDENMKTKAGTPYYVAPEVLKGSYDEKCDIWSIGVVCYILLCGFPPFSGENDNQILKAVKKGAFDFPSPEWDDISDKAKQFIKSMITLDPVARLSAEALLEDSWLKESMSSAPIGALNDKIGENLRKFSGMSKLKKVALTLIAQQLSDSKIQDLKNTFSVLDQNKDGTLTIKEITDGMSQHGLQMPPDMVAALERVDTDGSGSIDYTEFIAATLEQSKYIKDEVMWSAFRVFDKDGDGQITKEELRSVIADSGDDLARVEADLVAMIKEADTDKDGVISFEEFKAMMQKDG